VRGVIIRGGELDLLGVATTTPATNDGGGKVIIDTILDVSKERVGS